MPAPARKLRPKIERVSNDETARGPALRILPFVIIAAVCMLGFRIQVVVSDLAGKSGPLLDFGQPALAQNNAAQNNAAQNDAAEKEAAEGEQPAAEPKDGAKEGEGAAAADPAAAETAAAEDSDDAESGPLKPSELTKSEIETLQRLAERRQIIETRERELQQKESLLKAAEQRMDQKIAQMQEIEKQLQGLVQQYDAKKKTEIEQLVKIYTAMKPKDAARIFDELDMSILVPVVTSMKEAKVAPILSLMQAEKARKLTEEMSTRRKLPGTGEAG